MVSTIDDTREDGRTVVNGRAAVAVFSWLGFTVLLLQVGIVPLLPSIGRQLGLTAGDVAWLLTAELLAGAVALAVLTRLADLYGKRRVMIYALALVLVGSLIGCFTDNVAILLVARALMGAQTPMLALPEALASDTMTPKRARFTIATIHAGNSVGVGGGLLLGGLVGAFAVDFHAYFYVAAVVVAIGLVGTVLFTRETQYRGTGSFDVTGAVLLATGLVCLLLGLSKGPAWGWASPSVLGLLVGGLALLAAFCVVELRRAHPLIDVRALSLRGLWLPNIVVFLIAVGIYGAISAVTRFAQTPPTAGYGFGYTPLQVGLFAIPTALGGLVAAVVLQRLGRRVGWVAATGISAAFCLVAYVGLAAFHTVPEPMMISLGIYALGNTMGIAAAQILVLQRVPAERSGTALGAMIVLYAIGNSLGSTIVGVLFAARTLPSGLPAPEGYVFAFLVSGACVALAVALCIWQVAKRRDDQPALA